MSQANPFPNPSPFGSSNTPESEPSQKRLLPVALNESPGTAAARKNALEHLSQGNNLYNNFLSRSKSKDLDSAISHFRQALELDPNLAEGYVRLASALWDKGEINIEAALQYCQTAIHINPASPDGHLLMGYFLRKAGQLDQAMIYFETAILKAPFQSSKARIALGSTLIHQSANNEQKPAIARAWDTGRGLLQFGLGLMLLPMDQKTSRLIQHALTLDVSIYGVLFAGHGLKFLRLNRLNKKLIQLACTRMPDEPVFFHVLGDQETQGKNPDAAVYYYTRAVELDTINPSLYRKLYGAYIACQDKPNATRCLEKLVEYDPHDADTLYRLGQLHSEEKNYIRALYYYKECLRLSPENPYVHSNLAYIMCKLEDYDGAIEEYHQAIAFSHDPLWTSTVAQTLGTLYYQIRQDYPMATDLFRTACQLDPENLDSWVTLADLYFHLGNLEQSLQIYEQILQKESGNAECYNYMGYLLWQMGRNEDATQAYQEAIQLDPTSHIAYNNLGVIYLDEWGDVEEALTLFEKAIALKSDYTLACFNVGRCLELIGERTDAAKTYSRAKDLNMLNPELTEEEIEDRISELFQLD
ncbi:MAG: tetratricopeptide repeat protein [Vampirovibrio sp.]|nr:tetratricopeptide repeat protein [Vampirovibrio sp.]